MEERNILDVLAEQEVLVIPKVIPLSIAGSGNSLRETRLVFWQFRTLTKSLSFPELGFFHPSGNLAEKSLL